MFSMKKCSGCGSTNGMSVEFGACRCRNDELNEDAVRRAITKGMRSAYGSGYADGYAEALRAVAKVLSNASTNINGFCDSMTPHATAEE